MIVDFRRYTLKPGRLPGYLDGYGGAGYCAQIRHLGPALGWFAVDVGPQNQVAHLWRYDSLADMEARRNAMAADPDWLAARDGFKGQFAQQETEVMAVVDGLPYAASADTPGLVDIRRYTLHHGELPSLLSFLREQAAAIQARHWPDNLCYLSSLAGAQNQIVHIWGHPDHSTRLERRRALLADPDWRRCLETILPKVARMETMTATPTPFWSRMTGER